MTIMGTRQSLPEEIQRIVDAFNTEVPKYLLVLNAIFICICLYTAPHFGDYSLF